MITFILIVVVAVLAVGLAFLAFQVNSKRKGQKEMPHPDQQPPAPPETRAPGVD